MMADFRRIFHPTPEEQQEDYRKFAAVMRQGVNEKWCTSCVHFISVPGYHPGFVTGADADCDTGRCPIETCEDYSLDEEYVNELEHLERLGGKKNHD